MSLINSIAGLVPPQPVRKTAPRSRSLLPVLVLALLLSNRAVAQVEITGLDGELLDNALIHLDLDNELCDAPTWRVEDQFERAAGEIRLALEAYGFYDTVIASTLDFEDECWSSRFEVNLGEPVRLREVDIAISGPAEADPNFSSLVEAAALAPGLQLRHRDYDRLKSELFDLSQDLGYVEATFSVARLDIFPAETVADISLLLDSGPRYSFGEIEINQSVLDRDLLERYADFRTGELYDRNQLNRFYLALVDSGYFEEIDVRPLPADFDSKSIPIVINLTPGNSRLTTYGLGFSTDTGPRVRAGKTNRRLNTRGAQFGVNAQISPVISEVSANYRTPYGDPRSEWISLDTGIKHEDTESATSDSVEFGVRRIIARPSGWQETHFLNWLIEDFAVGRERSRSRLLTPGVSWLKVNADNALRPDRGYRFGIALTGAADALGSDASFLKMEIDGKWIRSFRNRGRLLARGRIGVISEDDFIELPPSVRFFAGGDNSIRGYKFESLGPMDAAGNVIGGDHIAIASLEYEHPVKERWSVAVFVDAGNAFTRGNFKTKSGAGVGFRWQSPLGPIRVDLAVPLNEMDNDVRLHVSLGADL